MDLQDRVVLLTGASSGIGAATAVRFARAGCDVALLARSAVGLEAVAARVRQEGRRAVVLPCDVTDRAAVVAAVARTEQELGGIDVLVSNAAAVVFGLFEDVTAEDFDRTVEICLTGAVNVIRAALPAVTRREGTMVVVGSIMTTVPLPTFSSYVAAKHGLRGFLSSLRIELRGTGSPVTISLINPGAVDTPLWRHSSSAGPTLSRTPPDAYSPDVLARAVVACARRPVTELTVGGEARAIELAWKYARPVGEVVIGIAQKLYLSGKAPARGRGSLWEGVGTGATRGGLHGRPSLWAPVQLAVRGTVATVPARLRERARRHA